MKLIGFVLGAWNTANIATMLVFAYRYIWFSTQTVPGARAFAVALMTLLSVLALVIWAGVKADLHKTT